VLVSVAVTLATRPLGTVGPSILPDPRATAYLISSPTTGLRPGDLAPELTATRSDGSRFELTDLEGRPIRLADLRGQLVWLNFWASWCPPCQMETPVLREVATTYRERGLALIGVQVQETVDDGRRYAQRYGLNHVIGADVSAFIFHLYRAYALPTQVFIDTDGRLRQVVLGPVTQGAAETLITPLLPSPAPSAPR
jgi:thiol-disulfide isomerase/thioredoxin